MKEKQLWHYILPKAIETYSLLLMVGCSEIHPTFSGGGRSPLKLHYFLPLNCFKIIIKLQDAALPLELGSKDVSTRVQWSPAQAGNELVAAAAQHIQLILLHSTLQKRYSQLQADMAAMAKGGRKVCDDSANFLSISCP